MNIYKLGVNGQTTKIQQLSSVDAGGLFFINRKPYELCRIIQNCGKNNDQTGYELHTTAKAKREYAKHFGFAGFHPDEVCSLFLGSQGNEI